MGILNPVEASLEFRSTEQVLEMALVAAGTSLKGGGHLSAPRQDPAVTGQPGHGPSLRHVLLEQVPDLQLRLQCLQSCQLLQCFLV